jgi:hypothetical protein
MPRVNVIDNGEDLENIDARERLQMTADDWAEYDDYLEYLHATGDEPRDPDDDDEDMGDDPYGMWDDGADEFD